MFAKYLVRLDDANHYMERDKWDKIETILYKNNIKPIVAVIPDNRDKNLIKNFKDKKFWQRVKYWENSGWAIGLHGYQHKYHKIEEDKSFIPIHTRSEFSGLSLNTQRKKINSSYKMFKQNKIIPKVFVAPSHTFDLNTLIALQKETEIKIISDGWSFYPFFSQNFLFIPQQLWKLKKKLFGIWTICLHPDSMSDFDILKFEQQIKKFKNKFLSLNDLDLHHKKNKSVFDYIFHLMFYLKLKLKKGLASLD